MDGQYFIGCFKSTGLANGAQTCAQCRWRKVRCDKRRGICSNCRRLGFPCSLSTPMSATVNVDDRDTPITPSEVQIESVTAFSQVTGRPRRLRGLRACAACREKKTRCSATRPSCTSCRQRGSECVYLPPKRGNQVPRDDTDQSKDRIPSYSCPGEAAKSSPETPTVPPSAPSPMALASDPYSPQPSSLRLERSGHSCSGTGTSKISGNSLHELQLRLVDIFFDRIYPMPSYSFLHPQTTKRRCRNGRLYGDLVSAICAITTLHLGSGNDISLPAATTASWVQAAEQSVWVNLESPNIPRLQTLLLIIHHRMETGCFQRAFMLTATAARFAAAMRLNHERPDLDPVAREARRRILWSLKIVERYFSSGLAEFDLFPLEVIYIDFPHAEESFAPIPRPGEESGDEVANHKEGDGNVSSEEGGAYRLLMQLESARRDIMKLTRSVALVENELPSLGDLLHHHAHTLSTVEPPDTLPGGDILTNFATAGLVDSSRDRWLPRRVLAHVSWHQAHCDLNRLLLAGYPEAAPAPVLNGVSEFAVVAAEEQCLQHAMRIIQIITSLNQHSTEHHLLEFDTAICAYHATRLILFISRFGRSSSRPAPGFAASRGDLCLAALKRFFPSSALVAPIIQELERSLKVFSEQQRDISGGAQYYSLYSNQGRQPSHGTLSTHAVLSSPERPEDGLTQQQDEGHSPKKQLSMAVQARQRLAIHSLLRRADFSSNDTDDENDGAMDNDRPGITATSPSIPIQIHRPERVQEQKHPDDSSRQGGGAPIPANAAPAQSIGDKLDLQQPLATELSSRRIDGGLKTAVETDSMTFSGINVGTIQEWEFTGTPSTTTYQETDFMAGLSGETQQSMFAWWGPQDWDWLFDADGSLP